MECPICGGQATLKAERVYYPFRKKNYEILEYSFICKQCNESFSTDELDERNVNQVYNQVYYLRKK
jgi:YgiT-type zinc finger domain-containing protein